MRKKGRERKRGGGENLRMPELKVKVIFIFFRGIIHNFGEKRLRQRRNPRQRKLHNLCDKFLEKKKWIFVNVVCFVFLGGGVGRKVYLWASPLAVLLTKVMNDL